MIRANEKNLADHAGSGRLMDAGDMQQALHILTEFGYGDGKRARIRAALRAYLPKRCTESANWYFHWRCRKRRSNCSVCRRTILAFLKVLLKAEALGTDPAPLMTGGGNIPPDKLLDRIRERNFIMLDLEMQHGFLRMPPRFMPRAATRRRSIWYWIAPATHRCSAWQRSAKNPFIADYCALEVDLLLNCRAFVRLRGRQAMEFLQRFSCRAAHAQ